VLYQPGTKDDALVKAVEQHAPDVLVVRSTKVTQAMLAAGALKLVVRAGAGYNTMMSAVRVQARASTSPIAPGKFIAGGGAGFRADPRAGIAAWPTT